MTWLQLDDNMPEHPKILSLSDAAFRLHMRGLGYCARLLTDGFVPDEVVRGFTRGQRTVNELRTKGVWKRVRKGYEIPNYTQWNPSRATVEARREAKKAAGVKGAEARWGDGTSHSNRMADRNAPIQSSPKDININLDDENRGPLIRLLDAMGEPIIGQAQLELQSFAARGVSEFEFEGVRAGLVKARPKRPVAYVRKALENRLRDRAS